jgi:hypothetical protein
MRRLLAEVYKMQVAGEYVDYLIKRARRPLQSDLEDMQARRFRRACKARSLRNYLQLAQITYTGVANELLTGYTLPVGFPLAAVAALADATVSNVQVRRQSSGREPLSEELIFPQALAGGPVGQVKPIVFPVPIELLVNEQISVDFQNPEIPENVYLRMDVNYPAGGAGSRVVGAVTRVTDEPLLILGFMSNLANSTMKLSDANADHQFSQAEIPIFGLVPPSTNVVSTYYPLQRPHYLQRGSKLVGDFTNGYKGATDAQTGNFLVAKCVTM